MDKKIRNVQIINKYNSGVSMSELVDLYKLHRSTIQRILKVNNIELRRRKSFINCNVNFFSEYNKESCYWAGFILADGNIRVDRNSLQIKLALKDRPHLIKFLKSIGCDEFEMVKTYKYKDGYKYTSLTISLDSFKHDLFEKFEIIPQKTFKSIISDRIPPTLLKHFIRGYLDGDGSITTTTIPTVSFVGTVSILTSLNNYFSEIIGISLQSNNKVAPIQYKNKNIGAIAYYGKNGQKILNELYSDVTENIILERKYKKFKLIFNYGV